MQVRISLDGCDDTTYLTMQVSEDELAFLNRLAAESEKASTYQCMPTLSVTVDNEGRPN